MKTEELIEELCDDLKPVRRLRRPTVRLAGWLGASMPAVALAVAVAGLRSDLATKLSDPVFLYQELASVAVAVTTAWAALVTGVPGEPRWKLLVPVLPLMLWLTTLGSQCFFEWVRSATGGMAFRADWGCIPSIAVISLVPALAIVLAIRRGARMNPAWAMLWGGLAAAALANAGLRLFHPEDAALMVIIWQFGSVALFTVLAVLGRNALVPAHPVRRRRGAARSSNGPTSMPV